MESPLRHMTRPVIVLALAMLTLFAGLPSTAAQVERDGPSAKYTVVVNFCLAPGCTELEEAIAPADGVAVEVSDADNGEVFSSCVTGADGPGQCTVDIRLVPTLAFAFDESTVPQGYMLDANPHIVPNQATEPGAHAELKVLLFPDAGFPPADSEIRNVPVRAMVCTDASCGEYQEGIFGVTITAVDTTTGVDLDSCITEAGNQIGGCALNVPVDSVFRLVWNESAIPEGLVPYGQPIPGPIASGGTDGYTLGFYWPTASQPPVMNPATMPASLYAGTCDALGERVVQINGPLVPDGPFLGSDEAIPVGVGYTAIDVPFDDLLAGPHVAAVFDREDPETLIACGAIGGVPDANGAISIGLAQVDNSGAVGVVYLNGRDGGASTGVSIFVVQQPIIEQGAGKPAA